MSEAAVAHYSSEAACPGDGFSGQPEMRRDAEEVA